MRTFREYTEELASRLREASRTGRAAFAAACAERLQPKLSAPGGAAAQQTLAALWDHLCGARSLREDQLRTLRSSVDAAILPDDDRRQDSYTEDALAAIAYAIEALLTEDPDLAVWAGRRPVETLDAFLGNIVGPEPDPDRAAWEHPLMREEIQRQLDDVSELTNSREPSVAAIQRVRDRARRNALTLELPRR